MNFSPRQISDPDLAPRILKLLTKLAFPPNRLVMEITESAVVQRLDEAKAVLQSLRNVGVRIALDDFGTGYSGLYHLRELELDVIKIDRSFVTKMLERPEEARIVKAIVSLSHALGLQTTAEGIESQGRARAADAAQMRHGSGRPIRSAGLGQRRQPPLSAKPGRGCGVAPSAARGSSPSAGLRAAARIPPWRSP